ncbi:MAG TPA: hypothetical protein PKA66_07320 [Gemmatimonadales bacterium]|nr:hypothetical protein [Gemmatimonadales bacterium]
MSDQEPNDDLLDLPAIATLTGTSPHRVWEKAVRGDYGNVVRRGRRIYVTRAGVRTALQDGLTGLESFIAARRRLLREV